MVDHNRPEGWRRDRPHHKDYYCSKDLPEVAVVDNSSAAGSSQAVLDSSLVVGNRLAAADSSQELADTAIDIAAAADTAAAAAGIGADMAADTAAAADTVAELEPLGVVAALQDA